VLVAEAALAGFLPVVVVVVAVGLVEVLVEPNAVVVGAASAASSLASALAVLRISVRCSLANALMLA
jgi:hypothetical protein